MMLHLPGRTNSDSVYFQKKVPHTLATKTVVQKATMHDISILACLPIITSPQRWILCFARTIQFLTPELRTIFGKRKSSADEAKLKTLL